MKTLIFFLFLLKTLIVGTRWNRISEAVLTSTHNLCFCAEIRKNNVHPCKPQFYYIKVGFKGVKTMKACFGDVIHLAPKLYLSRNARCAQQRMPTHSLSLISLRKNVQQILCAEGQAGLCLSWVYIFSVDGSFL